MRIFRTHVARSCFAMLPALFLALPAHATPAADANPGAAAAPLKAERQIPLTWSKAGDVQLQTIATSWQPVARVQFAPAAGSGAARQEAAMMRTGPLSWVVTPAGTQVLDNRTGSSASIPELTSNKVRPRDIVYDKQAGIVWFYGENLYRYQIVSHTLEQLRLSSANWQVIRKVSRGQAGLWLAAGNGIYLLDAADGTLKELRHPALAGAQLINLATGDRDAWFATADARLVRVGIATSGRFGLTVSAALPGVPADMVVAGQSVWLLMAGKHGDHYQLAYVGERPDQLAIMPGKYYGLAEKDGQLMASAYAALFRIDPANKTVVAIRPGEVGLLANAIRNESVLYAGLSYSYKDGCEIVEHAQLDISKGWTTAMGDSTFK